MKALSMWQPWASLWLSSSKVHETRPRRINHRGWLAVHAAKRLCDPPGQLPAILEGICDREFGENWRDNLPYGKIIGAIYVVDCIDTESAAVGATDFHCGNYDPGRFAIKRGGFFKIFPQSARGYQALFPVPPDISAILERETFNFAVPDQVT